MNWIGASTGREIRLTLLDDVVYFRADNKYTTVMTADGEALLRKPIRELLAVLDPAVFRQIHRSTIVSMKAVAFREHSLVCRHSREGGNCTATAKRLSSLAAEARSRM